MLINHWKDWQDWQDGQDVWVRTVNGTTGKLKKNFSWAHQLNADRVPDLLIISLTQVQQKFHSYSSSHVHKDGNKGGYDQQDWVDGADEEHGMDFSVTTTSHVLTFLVLISDQDIDFLDLLRTRSLPTFLFQGEAVWER